jgi:hypothetical protein
MQRALLSALFHHKSDNTDKLHGCNVMVMFNQTALDVAVENHSSTVVTANLPGDAAATRVFRLPQNVDYRRKLQCERFNVSVHEGNGILYRRDIVMRLDSLVNKCAAAKGGWGFL